MARETIGYTRLEWVCPNCKGKNPGPEKVCTTCGAPQPENVVFQAPDKDEIIKDESEIEKAKADPDIHCPYCGTRNPAGSETCRQCSGILKGGVQRASGKTIGTLNQNAVSMIKCPSCGSDNPANTQRCTQCGAQMAPAIQSTDQDNKKKIPIWGFVLIGLAVLLVICGGIWLVNKYTQRNDLSAVVQSVAWQRTITIEIFGPVTKENWKDSIPAGTAIGSCNWKVHHTQDDPAPNSDKVCGAPVKVDKGNGYSEVVQDCKYQVKKEYCEYSINEWHKSKEVTAKGTDLNPYWPDFRIMDQNTRQGDRSETYQINFLGNGKNYAYHPNASSFTQFTMGSKWKLVVDGFDSIISVSP